MSRAIFALVLILCGLFCASHSKMVPNEKSHHVGDEHNPQFDKEVLFSDDDEEDDDNAVFNLPLGEQKAKLKNLVEKKIDANQDGFVDRSELEAWALKAINRFEIEYVKEDFPSIDSNKDGLISWEEYMSDTYGDNFKEIEFGDPNSESEEWKSIVSSYNKDETMFKAADQDKDNNLDMSEFISFKHPRLTPQTREVLVEHSLTSSDTDKDGAISLDEFLGNYRKKENGEQPDWIAMEVDKFKYDFDLDGDGKLTGEEIIRWVASDNSVEASEEADHLIGECDTNADSKLTVSEILNNHELWLESDATDYGKQLLQNHDEL
uniref:Reticulocalbin-3 n=1 Tax=Phallusia mammillata TaxID=59560 RepID=A0A6F9DR34_9ASCI|nr:reticulocalbin-2-like [Phallusia mammillata]